MELCPNSVISPSLRIWCQKLNCPCPFQKYCVHRNIFVPTESSKTCIKRTNTQKEAKNN